MKAVRVHAQGGLDALVVEDIDLPVPAPGQVRVRIEAAGVNFIDLYKRSGLYAMPTPATLGEEGAGRVDVVGPGVTSVRAGDRVAFVGGSGTYAEYTIVPEDRLVPIPEGVATKAAAAAMLQGMTAEFLLRGAYMVREGDTILVHAAAGGVGLLLVQLAKKLGATVIGTTSTEEKAALARQAGADHIILYTSQDFVEETQTLTEGQGVHAVYDSVGITTFEKSLDCLRPRGTMVSFGQSSGPAPAIAPLTLGQKGSLFLTRPSLFHYIASRQELLARASFVLELVQRSELTLRIDAEFPLEGARDAQERLESRKSTGKILLMPGGTERISIPPFKSAAPAS
jgi:NADPH:quinone reductase